MQLLSLRIFHFATNKTTTSTGTYLEALCSVPCIDDLVYSPQQSRKAVTRIFILQVSKQAQSPSDMRLATKRWVAALFEPRFTWYTLTLFQQWHFRVTVIRATEVVRNKYVPFLVQFFIYIKRRSKDQESHWEMTSITFVRRFLC